MGLEWPDPPKRDGEYSCGHFAMGSIVGALALFAGGIYGLVQAVSGG